MFVTFGILVSDLDDLGSSHHAKASVEAETAFAVHLVPGFPVDGGIDEDVLEAARDMSGLQVEDPDAGANLVGCDTQSSLALSDGLHLGDDPKDILAQRP